MYDADDGERYQFNLIGHSSHVDFTYEIRVFFGRLYCWPLVVDATGGVVPNSSNAMLGHECQPGYCSAINKDLIPSARPEAGSQKLSGCSVIPADAAACVSGKTWRGIHEASEALCIYFSSSGDLCGTS